MKKAVVLLSGGLDSTTCLALAKSQGYACYALSFSYGQRHSTELLAAARIAKHFGAVDHKVVTLDVGLFGGSALTDQNIEIPGISREHYDSSYLRSGAQYYFSVYGFGFC